MNTSKNKIKKRNYPGQMSFRKALGNNPVYMQTGGKLYYQNGDRLPTLYVDPNDPAGKARYQAYQDSLRHYTNAESFPKDFGVSGNTANYYSTSGTFKYHPSLESEFLYLPYNTDNPSPDNISVGEYGKNKTQLVYKKPTQPVKYKPNPQIVAKQQQLIDAGFNIGAANGIWGKKSQTAWEEYQQSLTKPAINNQPILQNQPSVEENKPRLILLQLPNGKHIQVTEEEFNRNHRGIRNTQSTNYQKGGKLYYQNGDILPTPNINLVNKVNPNLVSNSPNYYLNPQNFSLFNTNNVAPRSTTDTQLNNRISPVELNKQIKRQEEEKKFNEIAERQKATVRSKNELTDYEKRIGASLAAGIGGAGLYGAGAAALPFLEAPAVIGNTTIPWLTANNLLWGAGAAYSTNEITNPNSDLRNSLNRVVDNPNLLNVADAVGNVGLTGLGYVGLPYKAGVSSLLDDASRAGKYLTTQTPLKNTWRYNPWRFKENPEAYYHRSPNIRNIVNQETGNLQGFGQSEAGQAYNELAKPGMGNTLLSDGTVSRLNLRKPANSEMYFSKGVPLDWGRYNPETFNQAGKRIMTGQGYPGPYIVEVADVPFIAKRNGKYSKVFDSNTGEYVRGALPPTNIESYAVSKRPISLDKTKFYKEDWLRGYKEVNVPKQLPGSPNAASSVDDVNRSVTNIEPIYRGVYINDEIRQLPKFKGKTDEEILDIMGTTIPGNTGTRRKKQLNETLNFGRDYDSALEHIGKHTDESSFQTLGNTKDLTSGKMYILKVQPDELPFISAEQQNKLYKETIDAWRKNNPNAGFILGNDAQNLNLEILRQFGESPVYRTEGVNVIKGNFPQFIGKENTKIGKLLESKEVTRQDYLDYVENLRKTPSKPVNGYTMQDYLNYFENLGAASPNAASSVDDVGRGLIKNKNTDQVISDPFGGYSKKYLRTSEVEYNNGLKLKSYVDNKTKEINLFSIEDPKTGGSIFYERGTTLDDNWKPAYSDSWKVKADMGNVDKDLIKFANKEIEKIVPSGLIKSEPTSISSDGLRYWNQQTKHGYSELEKFTNPRISASGKDDLFKGLDYKNLNDDIFSGAQFASKKEAEKAKLLLEDFMKKNGTSNYKIKITPDNYLEIDLPKLQRQYKHGGTIGNNGMFDMTNPNIYKSMVPIGLGLGAASQIEQKQLGGELLSNNIYLNPQLNNKTYTNSKMNRIYKKQIGGRLNEIPNSLNSSKMRNSIGRDSNVFEDIMTGLYGVGEGLLDTITGGMTDQLTDLGFNALQNTSKLNDEAKYKQKQYLGIGNIAGSVGAVPLGGDPLQAAQQSIKGVSKIGTGLTQNNDIENIGNAMSLIPGLAKNMNTSMAKYGGRFNFQKGGNMLKSNMGLTEIKGPSHEQGGVTLPNNSNRPDIEVEGPETIYTPQNYVMSEKIKASQKALDMAKLPLTYRNKSYADISKKIKNKVDNNLRPNDPLSKKMVDNEMKKLIKAHEYDKKIEELRLSKIMGGNNIIANTPIEQSEGYNMYPNANSIMFPGSGNTTVVPTKNNDPIKVTSANGNQQILTNTPIQTEAPFIEQKMKKGGKMIKRADGSYSQRGLWDNIRANRGSGKKPTKEMLKQEAKIKKAYGGYYSDILDNNGNFVVNPYKEDMYQMGGEMVPNQQQGMESDALMQQVVQMIQQGIPPEEIVAQLVQMGLPQDQAIQIVEMVVQQMQGGQEAPQQEQQQGMPMMRRGGYMYQMGGEMLPNNGMMGQEQNMAGSPQQGNPQDQLMQMVVQMLQQGISPEEIVGQLVQQGVPQEQAIQVVEMVVQQMNGQEQSPQPQQPMMRKGGYIYQVGGEMNNSPQNSEEQIMQVVSEMLQQGIQPEDIVAQLVQMGLPQESAIKAVEMIVSGSNNQLSPQQPTTPLPQQNNYMSYGGYLSDNYFNKVNNNTRKFQLGGPNNIPKAVNSFLSNNNVQSTFPNLGYRLSRFQSPTNLPTKDLSVKPEDRFLDTIPLSEISNPTKDLSTFPNLDARVDSRQSPITIEKEKEEEEKIYQKPEILDYKSPITIEKEKIYQKPEIPDYKSPLSNYIAGAIGSSLGPIGNITAAALAPDATYTPNVKLNKYDYTPIALKRAAYNQMQANTMQNIKSNSPTQGSYLSNMSIMGPSMASKLGTDIAKTKYDIDTQNINISNQENISRNQNFKENALLKDQSIANRINLGLKGVEGIGTNIQGFSKDMGARQMQDQLVNQLKTGDFSVVGYEIVNGNIVPKIAPTGVATYNNNIITSPNGQKFEWKPQTGKYEPIN